MPQFNMSSQVGARFRFVKHTGNPDEPNFDSGWHNNLVLDSGLARMSVGNYAEYIVLGASGDIPDVAQTGLISYLGYSSTQYGTDTTFVNTTAEPYYTSVTRTFRVGMGQATGSIAEAGLGWSVLTNRNNCFNRVLIKNNLGVPTPIEKEPNEVLDVLVELRYYPVKNVSGSFNLTVDTDTPYPVSYSGNAVLSPCVWPTGKVSSIYTVSSDEIIVNDYTTINNKPITLTDSGLFNNVMTYPTQTSANVSSTLSYSSADVIQKSMFIGFSFSGSSTPIGNTIGYKIEFDDYVNKHSDQSITYNFDISWGRLP